MSEVEVLRRQVSDLQEEVADLSFAVKQLTALVNKVDTNYHELTDRLVIKALQKLNQENEG